MHHWVVAVRATFSVASDGTLTLADEQVAPLREAEYFGPPDASSLRQDADLAPLKPVTDLILIASAYAPGGRPVERSRVGFRLGPLQKVIEVTGDRIYIPGPFGVSLSQPAPFIVQPIRYEGAYGGTDARHSRALDTQRDPRNPVGRGFAVNSSTLEGQAAPICSYPGLDLASAGPAGFGPIASFWSPRHEYAGTYDERWTRERLPLLPEDYDERFVACAPLDQQFRERLRGGETLELHGMTPAGYQRITLPEIRLSFTTRVNTRSHHHEGHLVSVIVEPDIMRLSLVWQADLPVRSRDADYLDESVVAEARA